MGEQRVSYINIMLNGTLKWWGISMDYEMVQIYWMLLGK